MAAMVAEHWWRSILFIPPQIPSGIHRNRPESSGMDRNPQELDQNRPESTGIDRNPQEWAGISRNRQKYMI
jgi:hypothetical protein